MSNMPSTIETLSAALKARSIDCTLTGEFSSILSFTAAPLSYTLRIAGSETSTTVLVIKSRENASNAFKVTDEDDLAKLCAWVEDFQSEKEKEAVHGQLRPKPQSDSALLDLLEPDTAWSKFIEPFAPAQTMVEWGQLLDAVVTLFVPFGLRPSFASADSISFGVEDLATNAYQAGPKIFRLKKHGFRTKIRGGLNLSTCVTLLYARTYRAQQAEADRKRMLSRVLVEAGYVGAPEEDDDFMPQKVLLYDLSKGEDRRALVARILLMRDLERKGKVPFEEGKWMGKQKNHWERTLDPEQRPNAHAYHLRKEAGRVSGLRNEIKEHDIDLGAEEETVTRRLRPQAGEENLLEWVLWEEQDKLNEELLEFKEEQAQKRERLGDTVPELTREEDDETVGPVTPPDSPPRHAFSKGLAGMGGGDEVAGMRLYAGTLLELHQ